MRRIAFRSVWYSRFWLATHPWLLVAWLYSELRDFVERGLYGYAQRDVYSLCTYLARWLPDALRELRKAGSRPMDVTLDEWEDILTDIAVGFEAKIKIMDEWTDDPEILAAANRGMRLFVKFFAHLWY